MKFKLIKKQQEFNEIVSLFFKPEEKFDFKAGQFLRYHLANLHSDERGENRFFSISSAPFEKNIRLTTKFAKNESSVFKKALDKLKIDDFIEATGPYGKFTYADPDTHYIFIAGGIGITPFRSILLDLDHQGKPLNITLLYANQTQEILFKDELYSLAKKHPDFKVHYFISKEPVSNQIISPNIKIIPGKINESFLKSKILNPESAIYYISGPEPMVVAFEKILKKLGVDKENTKRDYFTGYTKI